ncbi:MAG: VIT domain-containing protein, partial [Planctomycetota bacterium]|nr:VIT domain-containing protein [Planctomycetota bacterium]
MRMILALLLLTPFATANGVLTIRGRGGNVVQKTHAVKAVVRDRLAQVTVEQTFHNAGRNRLEGIYVFPLPDGASVTEFAMTMGGKMVTGQVLERGKAKRIYESIVSKKRDPGLLEKVDR